MKEKKNHFHTRVITIKLRRVVILELKNSEFHIIKLTFQLTSLR